MSSYQKIQDAESNPLAEPSPLIQNPDILASIFEFAPDAKLLVDASGNILEVNALAGEMFGYRRDELVGQPVEILLPERFVGRHMDYRKGYMDAPRTRPMGAGVDLFARRKDGTEVAVDIMLSPLETKHGRLALAAVRDITERKEAEAEAQQAREMYLKEVHHRVKNNLQVISSLLFLQSKQTADPAILEILQESQNRVKSIALIHEKLYRSPQLTKIDFAEYVRDLVGDICRSYGINEKQIVVDIAVEQVALEIDTAIPCGLIINELVTNVFKHAFPEGKGGRLTITLEREAEREFVLTVRDNGVGLPEGSDWQTSTSLGLRLVSDLTRQLDGKIEIDGGEGTAFRIMFQEVQYKERN